jgi:hypothetical protein
LALDFEDGDEVTRLLTIEDELYVMECRACSTQVGRAICAVTDYNVALSACPI